MIVILRKGEPRLRGEPDEGSMYFFIRLDFSRQRRL